MVIARNEIGPDRKNRTEVLRFSSEIDLREMRASADAQMSKVKPTLDRIALAQRTGDAGTAKELDRRFPGWRQEMAKDLSLPLAIFKESLRRAEEQALHYSGQVRLLEEYLSQLQ